MKYTGNILFLVLLVQFTYAQGVSGEPSEIKALIEKQQYEFVAQSASPVGGKSIFLSPGYTLGVSPDTLVSYLPYYGRAYQAPLDPSNAGIKFSSTDFTYTLKDRKKKGWDVLIKPHDGHNVTQVNLSISPTGSASVRITSIDRQSISFSGHIRKHP